MNGAPHLILSKICLMDKIKYMSVPGIPVVFFLPETRSDPYVHIATVNLLNASCSEISFISQIRQVSYSLLQLFIRLKQEIVLKSRS